MANVGDDGTKRLYALTGLDMDGWLGEYGGFGTGKMALAH